MVDILDKRPMDAEMTIFKTEVEPNKLNACIDNILMRIDKLETKLADVQPVKHGRWISKENAILTNECTLCKRSVSLLESKFYKYCPYCGARMDGDADERI